MHLPRLGLVTLAFLTAAGALRLAAVDQIASSYPPIVQGSVAGFHGNGLAIDEAGNRYICGVFSGAQDFNPGEGIDLKSSVGGSDGFVTRFNADGSYAWTQTLSGDGDDQVGGITVKDSVVFVTGVMPGRKLSLGASGTVVNFDSIRVFVCALDANTGAAKSDFGLNHSGIQTFGGNNLSFGLAITASSTAVYATGYFSMADSRVGDAGPPIASRGGLNTFVLALDFHTGAAKMGFGLADSGVQRFGGGNTDIGTSILLDGSVLYVGGRFTSLDAKVGLNPATIRATGDNGGHDGFVFAINAETGAPIPGFGLNGSGVQNFGGQAYDAIYALTLNNNQLYAAGEFMSYNAQVGGAGPILASNGLPKDAFVLALDKVTGQPKTSFGVASSGVQIFGGTAQDAANSLAFGHDTLYVAGSLGSSDAKFPGSGTTISTSGGADAWVAALDPTTGAPIAGFGSNGVQKFGGISDDSANGLALDQFTVYLAGPTGSTNAGVGGTGPYNAIGFGSFLLPLNAKKGTFHAPASVNLTGLTRSYTGGVNQVSATTVPPNLKVNITYNGDANAPVAAGNYTVRAVIEDDAFAGSASGTLTVTRASLTVSIADASRIYGDPSPQFTGVISGLQGNDVITATYSSAATAGSSVGTYDILPNFADPGGKIANYEVHLTKGLLTVTPAPLTITVENVSRKYHSPNPEFVIHFAGLRNADSFPLAFTTLGDIQSSAGTYEIDPTLSDPGSRLENYSVTINKGMLTIEKSLPAIAWNAPPPLAANSPLTDAHLNAKAIDPGDQSEVGGTFAYTPSIGTLLAAGLGQSLTANFVPADSINNLPATAVQSINIYEPVAITSALSAKGTMGAAFTYSITAAGATPITYTASSLPGGLTLNGNVISGTPTVSGVFDVGVKAANIVSQDSRVLRFVIAHTGTNRAPVFMSPLSAQPNPAFVGDVIALTASVTDENGDSVEYTWNFGDGTATHGATVTKVYTAPGVYVVTLNVTDGQASVSQSVNLVVYEHTPAGTFVVQKVKLAFNFARFGKDSLSISGLIPARADFAPAGKSVRTLIGLLNVESTLDAKGRSLDRSFNLKRKKGSSSATFTFAVKNQALFGKLEQLGFTKTQFNSAVSLPTIVVVDGISYFNAPSINYKATAGKSGSGKK